LKVKCGTSYISIDYLVLLAPQDIQRSIDSHVKITVIYLHNMNGLD
jgi:hypothetical protein